MKPTQEELNDILRLNGMWVRGEEGGKRANLTGADLRWASLRGANLSRAIGNMAEIKSMQIDTYQITWWFDGENDRLAIGCQSHTVEAWKGFSDAEIRLMDGRKALKWWEKWKDDVIRIVDKSPASRSHAT